MAGPLLFTQVFSTSISPSARVHLPGAPYFLAGLLLLCALLVAVAVTRRHAVAAAPEATP
jgi:DHA1 family tetracycline resistance protein-like MFS transporter